jgi:hypothetical protein
MPKRVCESNVAERQRQADEEKAKNDANFKAMRQMQERARAKRVEMYGEESEIEFEPKLKAFRDDMMSRIEDGGADLNEKMQIESGNLLEEVVERVPHKLTITEIEDDEEVAEESEVPALEKVISEPVEVMDDIIEPEDQEAAFEQDPMKIYKRPIAQHLVEKEIIEEIVYKSEDAEITLPLLDESASLKMGKLCLCR